MLNLQARLPLPYLCCSLAEQLLHNSFPLSLLKINLTADVQNAYLWGITGK